VVGHHPVPDASIWWLVGYSVVFAMLAWWGYRRDEMVRFA